MFRLTVLIITMLLSFNAHAVNADDKIDKCLEVNSEENDYQTQVEFINSCNRRVFVLYCGDLPSERGFDSRFSHCGSQRSQGSGYYVYGRNLEPNEKFDLPVKGEFHYAACDGGVYVDGGGYVSNNGQYKDDGSGGYDCKLKHYPKR